MYNEQASLCKLVQTSLMLSCTAQQSLCVRRTLALGVSNPLSSLLQSL